MSGDMGLGIMTDIMGEKLSRVIFGSMRAALCSARVADPVAIEDLALDLIEILNSDGKMRIDAAWRASKAMVALRERFNPDVPGFDKSKVGVVMMRDMYKKKKRHDGWNEGCFWLGVMLAIDSPHPSVAAFAQWLYGPALDARFLSQRNAP
jgi:hypothetical protein